MSVQFTNRRKKEPTGRLLPRVCHLIMILNTGESTVRRNRWNFVTSSPGEGRRKIYGGVSSVGVRIAASAE